MMLRLLTPAPRQPQNVVDGVSRSDIVGRTVCGHPQRLHVHAGKGQHGRGVVVSTTFRVHHAPTEHWANYRLANVTLGGVGGGPVWTNGEPRTANMEDQKWDNGTGR